MLALLALACDEQGGSRPSALDETGGAEGGAADAQEMTRSYHSTAKNNGGKAGAESQHVAVSASWSPPNLVPTAAAGSSAVALLVAPYGTSLVCGDAIVGATEECDDGPGAALDACTVDCKVRDQPAVALPPTHTVNSLDRYLGAGRHPVSGLSTGFATAFMEVGHADPEPTVAASLFNIWGQRTQHVTVSVDASPIDEANPVVAALPDGSFAFAWSDFDGDGSDLGVALRRVAADGSVGSLLAANRGTEFSQRNPDILWTGSQLVVAWEDYADAFNGPDLRYRTFDGELNPTSGDVPLAGSELPEAAVALAAFNGGWAAAYREGTADGKENVVVRVGAAAFRVGSPFQGGPLDDRPALVGLDATHLLVVFSVGTDPGSATGVFNVSRLRYAVVDVAGAATQPSQSLDPRFGAYLNDASVSQLSPSVAPGADGVPGAYIAWHSEARPGDAIGDQHWLKFAAWNATTATLSVTAEEDPIPRFWAENTGDQRRPQLAKVGLPPSGALAIAWDDYAHTQGAGAGNPDVAVRYTPMKAPGSVQRPKCTNATLTYNRPSNYAVKGEPFTFTATAVCHRTPQYRFVLMRPDGVWIEAQPWGPSPTFNWDTTNIPIGGWHAQVWVRDDPADVYQTYAGTGVWLNDYAACTSVSLTSDHWAYGNSYAVIGNTVHFTATAQCAGPARYQFLVGPSGQAYTVGQDWSASNTFDWDTTGQPMGYWNVLVHVTDMAFADVSQAYGWNGFILNHYAACTSATLTSDDADHTAPAGQVVHWTASSTCDGPAEYRFVFARPDNTWIEMQPWSSNNTFTWHTAGQPKGTWNMQVWVRDAPFYDYQQAYGPSWFILN